MNQHPHDHHDHEDHEHVASSQTALARAFVIIAAFTAVELVGGLLANSLTLIADAGHMFLDASALGLSWYAMRLSQRSADEQLSYGYHRFQVLAAFVNALTLLLLAAWILFEAIGRLFEPQELLALPGLIVAIIGLVINVAALKMLHGHSHDNLNVQSASLHVLGDLAGSIAAIAAMLIIYYTGWTLADPLLALLVAAILVTGAWRVLRESAHILLEGVPRHLDLEAIRATLAAEIANVQQVHHVHAWALTGEKPLVTLHATVDADADAFGAVNAIKALLLDRFGVDHSTVQVEAGPCPDAEAQVTAR
ncbi:MAG: cation diffusion facilitator family transporter [Pseudomonadota bacterium]